MTNLYKRHIKRLKLVSLMIIFLLSISAGKTLYIQILRPQGKNIVRNKEIIGKRGTIYDRNGIKLAYDIEMYDLFLDRPKGYNYKLVSSFMSKHFNLNPNSFDSLVKSSGVYFLLLLQLWLYLL